MNQYKSSLSLRMFYIFAAGTLWLGIGLTGFAQSSWVLYVPAFTFVFAAITGFCPSWIVFRKAIND